LARNFSMGPLRPRASREGGMVDDVWSGEREVLIRDDATVNDRQLALAWDEVRVRAGAALMRYLAELAGGPEGGPSVVVRLVETMERCDTRPHFRPAVRIRTRLELARPLERTVDVSAYRPYEPFAGLSAGGVVRAAGRELARRLRRAVHHES
jgi:hypothetical protein